MAKALDKLGDPFAITGFCSVGKDDVRLQPIKKFEEGLSVLTGMNLSGLKSNFSTRIGSIIRYSGTSFTKVKAMRKLVLVITDGEPSDVDVTDSEYLIQDARHAINALKKIKPPFNVSRPALFAASAAIKDNAWLNKEIKHVNKWNKKMFDEFKRMKVETNKSYSNFLLVNFDRVNINSSKVFKLLAQTGILVRKMDVYGIKNSLRITIGKSDENRKLISKMKKILNV